MPKTRDCLFGDAADRIPQELRIMFGTFVLTRAFEERMDEFNTRDGLPKTERHMLINLGVPRRMGQMAEDLNILPSHVTAVADELERKGLILRERDPDDRRAWQLRLTESGEAARLELIETTRRLFCQITGLGDEEIAQLATIMDGVSGRILEHGFPKGMSL